LTERRVLCYGTPWVQTAYNATNRLCFWLGLGELDGAYLTKKYSRFSKSSRGRLMAFRRNHLKKGESIVDWQLIFEQSPVNGGVYTGDELVPRVFRPRANSWFQHRLAYVRAELKKELLEEPTPFTKVRGSN
jgi:hypothetical protein